MYKLVLLLLLATAILACDSTARESATVKDQNEMSQKPSSTTQSKKEMNTLKAQLEATKQKSLDKWSEETAQIHQNGIDVVRSTGIETKALQVGDKAPDFVLLNHLDQEVKLSEALQEGPVVVTWYRGGWCPYCNLALHALQEKLPEIKGHGATLMTLTPEVPDRSLSTAEKNNLEFEVLSDLHNEVAHKFNIVFKLEDKVADAYQKGFDLHGYNGDESDELPLYHRYGRHDPLGFSRCRLSQPCGASRHRRSVGEVVGYC